MNSAKNFLMTFKRYKKYSKDITAEQDEDGGVLLHQILRLSIKF